MDITGAPIQCPDCLGEKRVLAFVDGHRADGTRFGGLRSINCFTCSGSGTIDAEFHARREIGKKLRAERVGKRQSLLEAARERGISPSELSAIEQGRAALSAPSTNGAVE